MNRFVVLKHPICVTILSGVILAILGNTFENNRKMREEKMLYLTSKLENYYQTIDDLAIASANYYSVVENYILDAKEYTKSGDNKILEERVWSDIQNINLARAPLFAILEKLKLLRIDEDSQKKLSDYYLLVIKITSLCQTKKPDKLNEIRILLDSEYTPSQTFFIYKINQIVDDLDKSK